MFFFKLRIFFLRILGYEKPLRVALLKYLSLKFKQFRPHYETILLETCLEAKKLGYEEVTVLELGVAGGNGIISLEKYKNKIEALYNIKINVYGFDSGEGIPQSNSEFDLPFHWKQGDFKTDKKKLQSTTTSKIIYGDVKNSLDEFIKYQPKNIIAIFFDMDLYTSTKNFLKQIDKLQNYLCPRVYCYFDDIFNPNHWINKHVGEQLAIEEFNYENKNLKIGLAPDNINDFKFPLAKGQLFMLNHFNHPDYKKYVGFEGERTLSINDRKINTKIF